MHVHSFRLSDQGERELMALMSRFQIYGGEQGPAFRLLLEHLAKFFREMDISHKSREVPPLEAEEEMRESSRDVLDRSLSFKTREEMEADQVAETRMRGKVGQLLFGLTIRELNKRGIPQYPQNLDSVSWELRKKLKVPETNCGVSVEEVWERYHLLFGGDLRKPYEGQLMSQ